MAADSPGEKADMLAALAASSPLQLKLVVHLTGRVEAGLPSGSSCLGPPGGLPMSPYEPRSEVVLIAVNWRD